MMPLCSVCGTRHPVNTCREGAPLKTERNTGTMERRVLRAARVRLGRRRLAADFEHGQWWVSDLDTGAQWSVVDAAGHRAVDGFDFEQVTQGEEG